MGAGVYVLTGTVMREKAGPATFVSYVLGAIAALLSGLCYAQFSVNVPKTGTAYNYVYIIAGELLAFLAGWNLLLEYVIAVASVGRSFSAYIDSLTGGAIANATEAFVGEVHSNVFGQIDFLAAGAILLVFIIVAVGVRSTVNVNNIMATVNSIVILTFIIAAFVVGNASNFNQEHGGFFPFGATGAINGAGVLFFAYVGFDAIAVAAEEAANPSKSLPVAMCTAIAIASVLYSGAALALSFLVPYYQIDIAAPFPAAFHIYGQDAIGYVITVGALFGICCSLLGQAFVLPRGVYALANDGLLFAMLKYVNPWTKTPLVAIGVSAVLSAVLAMILDIQALVEMVSIGTLFAMALMTACLIKLHYIPAIDCPFEITVDDDNASLSLLSGKGKAEKIPILKKKQSLADIGELRWRVPILSRCNSNKVTTTVIILLFLTLTLLSSMVVNGSPFIASQDWWALTLLAILAIFSVMLLAILLLYQHNKRFSKFSVSTNVMHNTSKITIMIIEMMNSIVLILLFYYCYVTN